MDRLGAAALRGLEDPLDREVRLARRRRPDRVCLVGEPHVERLAVRFGIDRYRGDSHLATRADHPDRDLAAIGDQELTEHLRGPCL